MLRLGTRHWELYRQGECKACQPLMELRDRFSARQWLVQFKGNALCMGALRHMLSREGSVSARLDRATDDDVIEQVAELFASGLWHVHAPERRQTTGTADQGGGGEGSDGDSEKAAGQSAEERAAAGSRTGAETKLTWIEIQLLDAEGRPMPGMAYEIKLPDGTVRPGKLDAVGTARHEEIVPGKCEVRFPDLDGGDWKPA